MKNMKLCLRVMCLALMFSICLFIFVPFASAHPGRTDNYGGHSCYTNCDYWGLGYGEYHYHNPKYTPQIVPTTPPPPTPPPIYYFTPESTNENTDSSQTQELSENEPESGEDDSWFWGLLVFGGIGYLIYLGSKKTQN